MSLLTKKTKPDLLYEITKTNDFGEIYKLIKYHDFGELEDEPFSLITKIEMKIQLCILRSLAQQGMKSRGALLLQEYLGNEDLDGDGLIYGKDWYYKNPPLILKSVPKNGEEVELLENN